MRVSHAIIPVYVALCLLLGGASAAGIASNLLLQLLAIPIIAAALFVRRQTPVSVSAKGLLALLVVLICFFAFQLVPLPPAIWTALPGREEVLQGFQLLMLPPPWLPVSLSPQDTLWSLAWLLPAIAVGLGMVRLGAFWPSWLAWTIIGIATVSVGVGAIQVAGGELSRWYFYQTTNRGFAVGFFANTNHEGTLLLTVIPFLAARFLAAVGRSRRRMQNSSAMVLLLAAIMLIVLVGLAITQSLAAIGLALPVAGASFLMILARRHRPPKWAIPALAALTIAVVGVTVSAPFANNLTTEAARSSAGSRYTSFTTTLTASAAYFPVGSGIGTFQQVYRTYENPSDITRTYMNHAHSDYLEILLETGLPGLALLALFGAWWVRRVIAIWQAEQPDLYARAATIASAAILAHSIVDYPLRTAAISAVFAACLAFMAEPRPRSGRSHAAEPEARHMSAD